MIRVLKRRLVPKTASYAVSPGKGDFSGSVFTTRGATGAVTFTLPAPQPSLTETFYEFINVVDQNMTVATTSGKAVVFNNTAATSLSAQTSSQKIGAAISAYCDGTAWLLTGASVGATYTVA